MKITEVYVAEVMSNCTVIDNDWKVAGVAVLPELACGMVYDEYPDIRLEVRRSPLTVQWYFYDGETCVGVVTEHKLKKGRR